MSTLTRTRPTDPDLSALEHLLAATAGVPELYATHLSGETATERSARHQAAADITDALLAEHPGGVRAGVEELAERTGRYVDLIERQAHARVASWIPAEGVAA
ncbi:hypothetical protein [Nocardiopsis sp. JB363]|uniref:hypothetical protein n=1 Tax=Nocardiopsis sp. JB363 TaxID=1434837 RepID=UPI00097AB815|nr:hypothetical protein [Nocardiopsis sp. JB363]SIO86166.1 hypothetical protein BQ8420_10625 [Nocardiopsis sp. JB363]